VNAGLPAHHGGFAAVPGLDHHVLAVAQPQALAAAQYLVLSVALTGHPDAPANHAQFAAAQAEMSGGATLESPDGVCIHLRIHHQSPCCHDTMIVVLSWRIQ